MEFDAELKFAKIQNSNVEGGWVVISASSRAIQMFNI